MAGTIAPYLYYEDGRAAVGWLCRAFGFTERMVMWFFATAMSPAASGAEKAAEQTTA